MVLSIVILNYNTFLLTLNCLRSIVKEYVEELDLGKIEIIVIDNASSDDSLSKLSEFAADFKNIKVFEAGSNLGFAKGCNFGEEKAKGNFVLFLNSDTKVLDKNFLKMADFLKENPKTGVVGGRVLNPNGSEQKSAGKFYTLFNFFVMILGFERLGFLKESPSKIKKIDWVSGAFMMVNKKIFDEVGKFDKNIFMYVEDMELCFRMKKAGFYAYFYLDCQVIHSEHGSSSRSFAIKNIYEEILYFYKKHMPVWQYTLVKLILFLKAKTLIFLGKIISNKYLVKTYSKALGVIK